MAKEKLPTTLVVKQLDRKDFPWGVWSEEDQTFVRMYQTESDAKKGTKEILKEIEDAENLLKKKAK